MPVPCPKCGTELLDADAACPACALLDPVLVDPGEDSGPAPKTFSDRLLAAFAYVFLLPALLFLILPSIRKRAFVRFHALQSVYATIATILLGGVTKLLASGAALIPNYGQLLAILLGVVFVVGGVMLWLLLMLKALQGAAFRLPIIGTPGKF